jgi:DNA-binding XRE family transcriptional regulator
MEKIELKALLEQNLEKITAIYPESVTWGIDEFSFIKNKFCAKAWVTVPENVESFKLTALLAGVAQARDSIQGSLKLIGVDSDIEIDYRSVGSDPEMEPAPKPDPTPRFNPHVHDRQAEISEEVLDLLRRIGHKNIACMKVGITRQTLLNWETDSEEFAYEVKRAIGAFQVARLEKILEAGDKYFQANAWALERLMPDTFAKHTVQNVRDWSNEDLETYVNTAKERTNQREANAAKATKKSGGLDESMGDYLELVQG